MRSAGSTILLLVWVLLGFLACVPASGATQPDPSDQAEQSAYAPHALQLTPESFNDILVEPNTSALIEFYAPWCKHCKNLGPEYEKAAIAFEREPNVVVAQINGDQYRELTAHVGVPGFPAIVWFPALTPKTRGQGGKETPVPYTGEHTEQDLIKFVNVQAGTFRVSGGGLASIAGRMPALDRLLNNYVTSIKEGAPHSQLEKIRSSAQSYIDTLLAKVDAEELTGGEGKAAAAKYYARVFDKVTTSVQWIEQETKRLERMLAKVTHDKIDDLTRKLNVLHAATDPQLTATLKRVAQREKDAIEEKKTKAQRDVQYEELVNAHDEL